MMNDSPSFLGRQYPRRHYQCAVGIAILLILFYSFYMNIIPSAPLTAWPSSQQTARDLSARTLLSRPVSKDRVTMPKIIHQTWFPAGSNMSEQSQEWVQTMKTKNPDWEYVLWDDETDLLLVKKYFPWFLEAYVGLPREILRADLVRNFYMYMFGGMYADVDTEALRSVEPLFTAHEVPLASHEKILSSWSSLSSGVKTQRAFLGRMSHSDDIMSSAAVPNGWTASPPGHPFWLLPILFYLEHPNGTGDGSVEGITGPGALSATIKWYYDNFKNQSLRPHVCEKVRKYQPSWDLFCDIENEDDVSIGDSLVLLPRQQIYPFSWVDDQNSVCLGSKANPAFDAEECKRVMEVEAWPSYFITYCTHSW